MQTSRVNGSECTKGSKDARDIIIGCEEGNFLQGQLLQNAEACENSLLQVASRNQHNIAPLALSFNLPAAHSLKNATSASAYLIDELQLILELWRHRPLGDLYWNSGIIEHLDEGELTEIAFTLSQKLKKSNRSYSRTAELTLSEASLSRLELLKGLAFNHILFTLPLIPSRDSPILLLLKRACDRAKTLGFEKISILLTFDATSATPRNLIALILDLPQCGPHKLILKPILLRNEEAVSIWCGNSADCKIEFTLDKLRKILISQGYKPFSFDQFVYERQVSKQFQWHLVNWGQLSPYSSDFIGIGPNAQSRLGTLITQNTSDYNSWSTSLKEQRHPDLTTRRICNAYLSAEIHVMRLLNDLRIDLAAASRSLNCTLDDLINSLESTLTGVPPEYWSINSRNFLDLSEQGRNLIPLLCRWLIDNYRK